MTTGQSTECEPQQVLRRRIGTTDYMVTVRFGNTSETLEQKLLRLMEREVQMFESKGRFQTIDEKRRQSAERGVYDN
jgi:hypothetical protein